MNILISNDDGIKSKGIVALAKRLAKEYNVLVVAPSGNRSAVSHSLTLSKTIKLDKVNHIDGVNAYSLSGTPADCVKFAKLNFDRFDCDVVVAGINKGHNIGSDILYSGTVAIAYEASFFGHIAFAFSAFNLDDSNFELYAEYCVKIIKTLLPISNQGDMWNVNFPDKNIQIQGVKITKLGKQLYSDRYELVGDNEYKLVGEIINHNENECDCDVEWIKKGYVTITPILFNKTNYEKINEVKQKCIELL